MRRLGNLTRDQRTALKELRGLEDQVILPADKENVTVVMRRCDYDRKMERPYRKLRGDPTPTQENRLSHELKGLEKNGEITSSLYIKLRYPQEANPLGFMACTRSTSLMSHSDPLFYA